MNYWFSSDLHIGHKRILGYCARTIFMTKEDRIKFENFPKENLRQFEFSDESLNNMNEGLISRWNSRVKKDDQVFHIGDFGFYGSGIVTGEGSNINPKSYEERLNGKILQIAGNHDKRSNHTKFIIERAVIKLGGYRLNLVHNPAHCDYNYKINLCGHVHNNWEIQRFKENNKTTDVINCGTDVWNFYPVSINEILARHTKWQKGKNV